MSCEHGVFFRPCGEGKDWEMIGAEVAAKWKDLVLPVLQEFASRTPGSMIEVKEVNLSWHYRYSIMLMDSWCTIYAHASGV
jgi:trehalose 6-phosphate synthase/phosphatase